MSFIKTGSGRKIDFLEPVEDQFHILDILTALARNHRFAGHSPLKIGQHILEVAALMMDHGDFETAEDRAGAGLVGMLHDFPEFAMGDCATPLKNLLGPLWHPIEERLMSTIASKYGASDLMHRHADLLKWADKQAVIEEAVRFQLDGIFVTDTLVILEQSREWVPDGVTRYLSSNVYDDATIREATFSAFLYLAAQAGLYDRAVTYDVSLSFPYASAFIDHHEREGGSILPALLLNGRRYF